MHNLDGCHSYVGILAFFFFQTLLLWMFYLTFWFGLLDNMGSENQKSQSMIAPYMVFFYMRLFFLLFFKPISSLNLKLIVGVDLASILQKWLTVHLNLIRELFSHSPLWTQLKSQFALSERLNLIPYYIAPFFQAPSVLNLVYAHLIILCSLFASAI